MPTVVHYARKVLLVSDNDAFNRLYELLGQAEINDLTVRTPVVITGEGHLSADSARLEARGEVYVPVSSEGEATKQAVRAPIQNRQPVGYQRAFPDDYQPNVTFYLPVETRRRASCPRSNSAIARP